MRTEQPANQTRRRFLMPGVVLGLLGGHMIFIFTAITLGTGDPSFAVVPDYYQKAVDYDERKSLLAESEALGWSAQLSLGTSADAIGQRELFVRLRDQEGQPVEGLELQVAGYHLARAGEQIVMDCVEVMPGVYAGQAKMNREGFWQYAIDATGNDQRYVTDLRQFVPTAEGTK